MTTPEPTTAPEDRLLKAGPSRRSLIAGVDAATVPSRVAAAQSVVNGTLNLTRYAVVANLSLK